MRGHHDEVYRISLRILCNDPCRAPLFESGLDVRGREMGRLKRRKRILLTLNKLIEVGDSFWRRRLRSSRTVCFDSMEQREVGPRTVHHVTDSGHNLLALRGKVDR